MSSTAKQDWWMVLIAAAASLFWLPFTFIYAFLPNFFQLVTPSERLGALWRTFAGLGALFGLGLGLMVVVGLATAHWRWACSAALLYLATAIIVFACLVLYEAYTRLANPGNYHHVHPLDIY